MQVPEHETQIVPLVVGDARLAMRITELALDKGVFAQAIRPPTVPAGTSRLRLAVMSSHTKAELRDAARILARTAIKAGFRPPAPVPAPEAKPEPAPAGGESWRQLGEAARGKVAVSLRRAA
jgi:glycine C-acetyltransferase/8-amino-7-oxononanoate synthase